MLNERDAEVLRHIIRYCSEINHTIDVFGNDQKTFNENQQ